MTTDGSLSLRGYDRPPSFAFPRQRRVPRCPRLEVKPSPLRSIKITREEKAPEHVRVFPSWTVLLDLEKIAKGVKKKKNLDRENSPKREKPNGCYKLTGHFRSITPRMTQVELFYSDSTKKKKRFTLVSMIIHGLVSNLFKKPVLWVFLGFNQAWNP